MILSASGYARCMLTGKTIHLCVTGGIACYKAVELARALIKLGAQVRVAMSENAQQFVGPLTFQAITQAPVMTRTLDPAEEMLMGHIEFAQRPDVLLIAPATANSISKAALGIGDELISTICLASNTPVVMAPAMNSFMYEHPAIKDNLTRLDKRGWTIVAPEDGELACGHVGPGRLASTEVIVKAVIARLGAQRLEGRRVIVSAGPTQEFLDPVRFLSNPSSGRTGFELARALHNAGAHVVLVHGPVALTPPAGVEVHATTSATEMHAAIMGRAGEVDAIFMTAAVADWQAETVAGTKMKKTDSNLTLSLVRTPDILHDVGQMASSARPILIGWAAETGDPLAAAQQKRRQKNADLIVANDVSAPGCGFGTVTNEVILVESSTSRRLPMQTKTELGHVLVDWLVARLENTA
ncbi:MAG: bifunctional phosphopantothenoylcysteine decarboxylase/phosphopantothenate--cysteine ligase CoaBC [Myxococcota bacterium]|nr:bifunctional phosphopantothenoylcysteine decarboxylase/phosphopantothenate--cysteine ligase CoaBC [Myxococcota bacterium]